MGLTHRAVREHVLPRSRFLIVITWDGAVVFFSSPIQTSLIMSRGPLIRKADQMGKATRLLWDLPVRKQDIRQELVPVFLVLGGQSAEHARQCPTELLHQTICLRVVLGSPDPFDVQSLIDFLQRSGMKLAP
jgi:hypothetical protein